MSSDGRNPEQDEGGQDGTGQEMREGGAGTGTETDLRTLVAFLRDLGSIEAAMLGGAQPPATSAPGI